MSARATQANRLLALAIDSLDADALLIVGLEGREAVSDLFSFRLKCVSEVPDNIELKKILDRRATIRVRLNDGSDRYINGFVSHCSCDGKEIGGDQRFTHYTVEIVPWLWMLTRTTDCRIFQGKSAPDIIQQIFKDSGFTDFKLNLQGSFEPRDYCVQYRETDFNFVSRLMEEEGIFYFFEHQRDNHKLVLVNSPQLCNPCPKQETARYEPEEGIGEREDYVLAWSERRELRSGKYTHRDHQFQMPDKSLEFSAPTSVKVGRNDNLELYDYPGLYAARFNEVEQRMDKVEPLGDKYAKLRMEEEESQHLLALGTSNCRAFFTGSKFKFRAPSGLTSGEFLLMSLQHTYQSHASYVSGGDDGSVYMNQFTCIPTSVTFRPPRKTHRPVVHGSQTAVVVGPDGEEIYPDKFSRIKVQFHWDREGENNERSSCWVRVGTPWAGKQWGMIHIPRIGQEVIVQFLEGDPDQPIIVGSVYNADYMPPYELPANKTQSGVKSRSSLNGSPSNFNEIRFEDKKGSEQVFIHAEKNQDIEVENDETHWVGRDRTKTIDRDETTHVKRNRTETVDKNETITIGVDRTETVGKDERITIGANRTEMVGNNETITIGATRSQTIGKDEAITINAGRSVQVAKDETIKIGSNSTQTIGSNSTINVGKKLVINAGDQILIQTGAASVLMKKDGTIVIKGKDISITGSGAINVKASKDVVVKGKKILQN